jgi:hypothetical protein
MVHLAVAELLSALWIRPVVHKMAATARGNAEIAAAFCMTSLEYRRLVSRETNCA